MYLVRSHKGSLVGPKTVNFSHSRRVPQRNRSHSVSTNSPLEGLESITSWLWRRRTLRERWRHWQSGRAEDLHDNYAAVPAWLLCWMFLSGTCHRLRQEVRTHPDAATGDPAWWQQIFQLILEQWSTFKSTFKGIFWKKNLRIWDKDFSDSPSRIWKNQDLAVLSFLVVHLHSNEWVLDASEAQRLYVPLRLEGYGSGRGPVWELTKADESTTFQISSL